MRRQAQPTRPRLQRPPQADLYDAYSARHFSDFYRRWLSPALHTLNPGGCRFVPTCSEYAAVAIADHGPLRGVALAIWRLLRCHPFSRGGLDPVPPAAPRVSATNLYHRLRGALARLSPTTGSSLCPKFAILIWRLARTRRRWQQRRRFPQPDHLHVFWPSLFFLAFNTSRRKQDSPPADPQTQQRACSIRGSQPGEPPHSAPAAATTASPASPRPAMSPQPPRPRPQSRTSSIASSSPTAAHRSSTGF